MFKKTLFIECPICKTKKHPDSPRELAGYFYATQDNGSVVLTECQCHKKWMLDNKALIQASKNNIWTNEKDLKFSPFEERIGKRDLPEIRKIVSYVENFTGSEEFREASLYIYGEARTQKTTLAQWIGLSMALKGYSVYYNSMHNFIINLVPTGFTDIEKYKVYHNRMIEMDFLIIDDAFNCHQANIQTYQLPYIEAFFRERIEMYKKGIIFVSCIPPHKIKENKFSSSLQDFIEKNLKKYKSLITLHDTIDMVDTKGIFEGIKNDK